MPYQYVGRTPYEVKRFAHSLDIRGLDKMLIDLETAYNKELSKFKNKSVLDHYQKCYRVIEAERNRRWRED